MTDTDFGKILDMAVKGSAVISSARKINKAMNITRLFSFSILSIVVIFNVFSIVNALKQ